MKLNLRQTACLVLALFLLSTAAGCGIEKNVVNSNDNVAVKNDQVVKVTILTSDYVNAPINSELPVMKELTKKTNVIPVFQLVPGTDLAQKIDIAIASKSLPDIVCSSQNDMSKYYSQGLFSNLTDFYNNSGSFQKIFTRFPNMKKNLQTDEGDFYFVPIVTERVYCVHEVINNDFLKKVDMEIPDTLEDLEKVLIAFKALGKDIIPWGRSPWCEWKECLMNTFDTSADWFYFGGDKYEYGPYDRADNYKQYLMYANKLYTEGLIDKNIFSTSDDDAIKQLRTNTVGFTYGWGDSFSEWGKGGTYGTDFVPMLPLTGPDGKKHAKISENIGASFFVSAKTKYAAQINNWFNYIYSDEGINLMNWGIEGVTYTESNGQKTFVDEILHAENGDALNTRRKFGMSTTNFPCYCTKDSESVLNGPLTSFYNNNVEYAYPSQPIMSATTAEQQELTSLMIDINKYVNEQTAAFITGKIKITNESFEAFQEQLKKLNIERAETIQQAKFKRWQSRK